MIDDVTAIISLALTVLGMLAAVAGWAHNRMEGVRREAREYVDDRLSATRENTREVYARREDIAAIKADVVTIKELVKEVRHIILGSHPAE